MSDTALAFKRGFAERIARAGLTPSMVESGMSKQAVGGPLGWLATGAAKATGAASEMAPTALKALLGAWLVGPVVAGGLGGYASGKMQGMEPPDLKAMREEERVSNIRRAVKALKRQQGLPV